MRFDLAVLNSRSVITCAASSEGPKREKEMREVHPIPRGVVGIVGQKIAWIGNERAFRRHSARKKIDAEGGIVLPGFIDCHTHAVFAGNRIDEWQERLSGVSYLENLKKGGGILQTVRQTRRASAAKLYEAASN
jgi:imidazolonepropionase